MSIEVRVGITCEIPNSFSNVLYTLTLRIDLNKNQVVQNNS